MSPATPNPSKENSLTTMKLKTPFLPLISTLVFLLFLVAPSRAAQDTAANTATQQARTITGRVQNSVTGQYLNNARVSVRGTTVVALTDQTGTYRLVNVPAGALVLEAFYTGLD